MLHLSRVWLLWKIFSKTTTWPITDSSGVGGTGCCATRVHTFNIVRVRFFLKLKLPKSPLHGTYAFVTRVFVPMYTCSSRRPFVLQPHVRCDTVGTPRVLDDLNNTIYSSPNVPRTRALEQCKCPVTRHDRRVIRSLKKKARVSNMYISWSDHKVRRF